MVFYKTVFYNNIYDLSKYIVLAEQVDKIIELEDVFRGYIKKEHLFSVNPEEVGEHSYVVEYITTTYNSVEKIETNRIKVL